MNLRLSIILILLICFAVPVNCFGSDLTIYKINDTVPVVLNDDYGVMLINDGGEENPIPRYILAVKSDQTVLDTRDMKIFKEALSKLPVGVEIFEYISCTVPRWYGLTDKQVSDFANLFRETDLSLSEEKRITCYCEKAVL